MWTLVCLALLGPGADRLLADGIETLGEPNDLSVQSGSGIIAAGTGLFTQPGTIDVAVPAGATVQQVLLYWYGRGHDPDDSVTVNGIPVSGALIGMDTPGLWPSTGRSRSFRADITDLGLVVPGANTLTIEDMSFSYTDDGAGVLVIYQLDDDEADIQLLDGHDFAGAAQGLPAPLDATVPQTFVFDAVDEERTAHLILFVGNGEAARPDAIEYTVGGVTTTLTDEIVAGDGDEWDTFDIPVTIPAGETTVTVELISRRAPGVVPDSFAWILAALSVPVPAEPIGGEGCTPGYWKQRHHFGSWPAPYTPNTPFSDVFANAFPGKTLLQVLSQGGGGLKALGRHTVAALLSAASPDVNYDLAPNDVIDLFNRAYAAGRKYYERLKNFFERLNQQHCPLGRADADSAGNGSGPHGSDDSTHGDTSSTGGLVPTGACGSIGALTPMTAIWLALCAIRPGRRRHP